MSKANAAIDLFDGVQQPWFNASAVAEYISGLLTGFDIRLWGPLLATRGTSEDLAKRLCGMRVVNPARPVEPRDILKPEISYEQRALSGKAKPLYGVLYDGNELQRAAHQAIPRDRRGPEAVNIWFTQRAMATWDEADRRYHARVVVLGQPSIVSTTGVVIAPARSRAYYLSRRLGVSPGQARASQTEDFVDFEQPRIAEAAKGYAAQAVLHTLAGDPFCDNPRCRLYNAHWQSELIEAQFTKPDFCGRHRRLFESLGDIR